MLLALFTLSLGAPCVQALNHPLEVADSTEIINTGFNSPLTTPNSLSSTVELTTDTVPAKPGVIQRFIRYFSESNKIKPDKKFDISFIGGPSYNKTTSLLLAVLASGLYQSRRDSLTPYSNVSLYIMGSINGVWGFGVKGNHFGPNDRYRVNYGVKFNSNPMGYWGIGFDKEFDNSNVSDFTQLYCEVHAEFLWHFPYEIFLGPAARFAYNKATKARKPQIWEGEPLTTHDYGVGFTFSRDTRDNPTFPHRGFLFAYQQMFYPRFLGNNSPFSLSDFTVSFYQKMWRGSILAARYHLALTYGGVPSWSMLPALDYDVLRGYQKNRYRDRHETDLIIELRQHAFRRASFVAWGGVGYVFDKISQIQMRKSLPTWGLGFRWELKKNVNVRIDYGWGRRCSDICFSLNEAF